MMPSQSSSLKVMLEPRIQYLKAIKYLEHLKHFKQSIVPITSPLGRILQNQ